MYKTKSFFFLIFQVQFSIAYKQQKGIVFFLCLFGFPFHKVDLIILFIFIQIGSLLGHWLCVLIIFEKMRRFIPDEAESKLHHSTFFNGPHPHVVIPKWSSMNISIMITRPMPQRDTHTSRIGQNTVK